MGTRYRGGVGWLRVSCLGYDRTSAARLVAVADMCPFDILAVFLPPLVI